VNPRLLAALFVLALAACASSQSRNAGLYDPRALPAGPLGDSIAYGYALIVRTHHLMKPYVRADLECADCHIAAGTQPRGGSFVGVYGRFPQWNKRARRVIALQDRIAECFLYSMNGRAPAYNSKAMIAIVAYIAWLSRDTTVGAKQPQSDRYVEPLPSAPPNPRSGARIFVDRCARCHGLDGQGLPQIYPPLWGARSFNDGAGMAHLDRMTGFVRYNMPQDAPGSLSLAAAYDVAAFVLGHARPHFRKNALVVTRPLPAKYF
jgi:thiosulfate dehydrogenase